MVLGWWIVYYVIALVLSLAVWFVYKISHRGFVVYAVTLFAVFWLFGGGGCNWVGTKIGEQFDAAPWSAVARSSNTEVPGSRAPRAEKPTIVKGDGDDGAFQVSIDGSNEYGLADPAPGHRTGIRVKPFKTVLITHLGGTPAFNSFGLRKPVCGEFAQYASYIRLRFRDHPAFAVGAGLADAENRFPFQRFPCDGRRQLRLQNTTRVDRWVVFFFNLPEHYRDEAHKYHRDGFAYGGWDGQRVYFLVELL